MPRVDAKPAKLLAKISEYACRHFSAGAGNILEFHSPAIVVFSKLDRRDRDWRNFETSLKMYLGIASKREIIFNNCVHAVFLYVGKFTSAFYVHVQPQHVYQI